MKAIDLLRMQLLGSCDLVAAHARESGDVWTRRAFPGGSLPGFVAWHCARIVDWGVHTVVREVDEVAAGEPWRERVRYDLGHGAGLTDAEADVLANTVAPHDVAAYAGAVRDAVDAWVSTASDDGLDRVPALRQVNESHPRYATAGAWAEIQHLEGQPAWQFLARPCIAHVRIHMGEFETLCQAARAGAAATG